MPALEPEVAKIMYVLPMCVYYVSTYMYKQDRPALLVFSKNIKQSKIYMKLPLCKVDDVSNIS